MEKMINFNDYDLFIVDFDGTIVDTMAMWKDICPNFVRSMNKEPSNDIYIKITSKTNVEIARFVRDEYFPELDYELVVDLFYDFIRSQYVKQDIKPNAIKLLEDLNTIGKVVLYSATASSVLNVLLAKFDLYKYFDNFYSGSDLGITKKDGTGYLEVVRLEGGCNKALVLEDALHAIIGARSQGFDVLAILDISNINKLDKIEEYTTYLLDLNEYKKNG